MDSPDPRPSEASPDRIPPDLLFEPGRAFATALDEGDPLRRFRARFELPGASDGTARVYLLGNSLGPLPRAARREVAAELDAWAARGVESYFEPPRRWYEADARHRASMAGIVGARPEEVALFGSLTTNLHLLLASFFRPRGERTRILVERPAFPSDLHVARTQLAWHGLDPADALIEVGHDPTAPGRDGPADTRLEEAIERVLAERGESVALVFVGGVNYLTGEAYDLARIVRAARRAGCAVGFDLAHAAGNVPLALHAAGPDFAAWCTYKYLNAGPGAVAGVFVHERHLDAGILRLGGWWGVDPDHRFEMRGAAPFTPRPDAAGWQQSCPPILAMAPLGPALEMFDEAGMAALRAKSERLTAYLEWLLRGGAARTGVGGSGRLAPLTPADPARRGAQLSYRVEGAPRLRAELAARGVDVDLRDPDVLRFAPAPLFNGFEDAWRAARHVLECLDGWEG